jgi:hypothetical protein
MPLIELLTSSQSVRIAWLFLTHFGRLLINTGSLRALADTKLGIICRLGLDQTALPCIRFHDLRLASRMLSAGVHLKVAS